MSRVFLNKQRRQCDVSCPKIPAVNVMESPLTFLQTKTNRYLSRFQKFYSSQTHYEFSGVKYLWMKPLLYNQGVGQNFVLAGVLKITEQKQRFIRKSHKTMCPWRRLSRHKRNQFQRNAIKTILSTSQDISQNPAYNIYFYHSKGQEYKRQFRVS